MRALISFPPSTRTPRQVSNLRNGRLAACATGQLRLRFAGSMRADVLGKILSRKRRIGLVLAWLLTLPFLIGCRTSTRSARAHSVVPERQVKLEGQPNFRDLGGYRTVDGRSVKWGLLYRSGTLEQLTDADLEQLRARGIRKVIDLRVDSEVEKGRDRLPAGAQLLRLPVWPETNLKALSKALNKGDVSGITETALRDANRDFVRNFSGTYADLLKQISDPAHRPILWHCTLGKDRAGLGAAIVLLALGVPEEVVMEDYLLSNRYRASEMQRELSDFKKKQLTTRDESQARHDAQVYQALLEARREYLQAAFDEMAQERGSIEAYLHGALGLTPEQQKNLQSQLLERKPLQPPAQRR